MMTISTVHLSIIAIGRLISSVRRNVITAAIPARVPAALAANIFLLLLSSSSSALYISSSSSSSFLRKIATIAPRAVTIAAIRLISAHVPCARGASLSAMLIMSAVGAAAGAASSTIVVSSATFATVLVFLPLSGVVLGASGCSTAGSSFLISANPA